MEQEGTYYEKLWFIQTKRGEWDMSSIYGASKMGIKTEF